jgi:ribose transport system substrate-binding protein/inositol transport system substrate-binding protein
MKRKVIVSLLIFGLLLSACASSAAADEAAAADTGADTEAAAENAAESEAAEAAADDGLEICVVHNNADHPSITAIVEGMDEEAAIYGAEVTYFDPAFDPQKQASMIEDCIARQPDVIVVNAVDAEAVVAPIKKAYDAGIPVITQNANCSADGYDYIETFVGSQSYDQGYAVGKMMAEKLGDTDSKVIFLGGKPGQTDYVNRVQGAKDAWADVGVSYEVLADQPAEWSKDKALSVMQDLLTRYPEGIDAVYAVDDPMAIGALEAIKAASREDEIAVYGTNGNVDACAAIEAGEMAGTALQMSYLVGVYTVRTAYDVSVGRLVADEVLAPTAPVTGDNVDYWMSMCW